MRFPSAFQPALLLRSCSSPLSFLGTCSRSPCPACRTPIPAPALNPPSYPCVSTSPGVSHAAADLLCHRMPNPAESILTTLSTVLPQAQSCTHRPVPTVQKKKKMRKKSPPPPPRNALSNVMGCHTQQGQCDTEHQNGVTAESPSSPPSVCKNASVHPALDSSADECIIFQIAHCGTPGQYCRGHYAIPKPDSALGSLWARTPLAQGHFRADIWDTRLLV